MNDISNKEDPQFSEIQITLKQALKYAQEFSNLFQSEKEKRFQLEKTNSELSSLYKQLKETLEELKSKEALSQKLGRVLDQISDEIFILERENLIIQHCNSGARKNLTTGGSELIGKPFLDFFDPQSHASLKEIFELLDSNESEKTTIETSQIHPDSPPLPVEIRLFRNKTIDEDVFIAIVHDISSRKAAMEEILKLRKKLEMENTYLKEEVKSEFEYDHIIGSSVPMSALQQKISMISQAESAVLIQGETGTGKELIARALHEQSPRARQPLIKVNCCAIPNELFESEFFGHVRGAFTGALRDRDGRFQLADGGSLFLDEIAEIPPNLQGKLLRVLQEGTFERVGEEKSRSVDVRIIAATNCNLKREVDEGRFRSDLYYRLSVIPLEIPPLREREGDIRLLADHFWSRQMRRLRKPFFKLSENDYQTLERYNWPGNIRELQNVIERVSIISPLGGPISWDMAFFSSGLPFSDLSTGPDNLDNKKDSESEKKRILSVLEKTNWKVYGPRGAAEFLHVKPTTLAYRIKKLGLKKPGSRSPSS